MENTINPYFLTMLGNMWGKPIRYENTCAGIAILIIESPLMNTRNNSQTKTNTDIGKQVDTKDAAPNNKGPYT